MIDRIVKMNIKEDFCSEFERIFKNSKSHILNQKGCIIVKLLKNPHHTSEYFTYSLWETEDDLNNYRKTEFFKNIWSQIKPHFNAKAEAWSLIKL